MKLSLPGSILAIVAVLALAGAGCYKATTTNTNTTSNTSAVTNSSTNTSTTNSTTNTTTNQAAIASVSIVDFSYSPSSLTVAKGTKVTWTNNGSALHTVTGTSGGPNSNGNISPGGTYSFTFDTAGTFSYRCGNHASMQASVTVTE